MIWLTGVAGFDVLIRKMKGHLFFKHPLNTYYVPGAMLGVGDLDKKWIVPAPRPSVPWKDRQLNLL